MATSHSEVVGLLAAGGLAARSIRRSRVHCSGALTTDRQAISTRSSYEIHVFDLNRPQEHLGISLRIL